MDNNYYPVTEAIIALCFNSDSPSESFWRNNNEIIEKELFKLFNE